jgi:hypothetical protein
MPEKPKFPMAEKYDLVYLRDLMSDVEFGFIEDALEQAEKKGIELGKDIGARVIGKIFLDNWEYLRTLHKDELWARLKAELSK